MPLMLKAYLKVPTTTHQPLTNWEYHDKNNKKYNACQFVCRYHSMLTTESQVSQATPEVEKSRIKAHLEFLADDYLEGRDTGSRGYEIAANYVVAEFKKLGLKPAGEEGYLQRVPFRRAYLNQQTTKAIIYSGEQTIELNYPQDYIASTVMNATEASVKADAVFVGYGLVAENMIITTIKI